MHISQKDLKSFNIHQFSFKEIDNVDLCKTSLFVHLVRGFFGSLTVSLGPLCILCVGSLSLKFLLNSLRSARGF